MDIDEYCENHGEWSSFGNEKIYFKKKSSFYFTDLSLINLNFIHPRQARPKFLLSLEIRLKPNQSFKQEILYNVKLNVTTYNRLFKDNFDGKYYYSQINTNFNLNKLLEHNNQKISDFNPSIKVDMFEYGTNSTILNQLELRIKPSRVNGVKKDTVMVCSKLIFLDKSFTMGDYEFWAKLNAQFGVKKIQAYYLQTNKNKQLHKVFKSEINENNFEKISNLKCVPNTYTKPDAADTGPKFYREFQINKKFYTKLDLINGVLLNECYLENIDKYYLIKIVDTDEVIFPKSMGNFNIHSKSLKNQPNNDISYYLNTSSDLTGNKTLQKFIKTKIKNTNGYRDKTYLFPTQIYLKNKLIDKICSNLERLMSNSPNMTFGDVIYLKDLQHQRLDFSTGYFDFILSVSSSRELEYGKELCELNHEVIAPFLTKFKIQIRKLTTNFDKFFMLQYKSTGKSIHSTDKTFSIGTHYSIAEYASFNNKVKFNDAMQNLISYKHGHVSHFRPDIKVKYTRGKVFPLQSISLDLSYFEFFKNKINE